ncbi:hypothetical protein M413DRAFT_64094 [Hebeloma cylindrosporum]|uniref:Cytochrome P450 n=1 Tax=Hebeloma cylindrosporum TaxID=76867 RepID=A0A0C3CTC6_HEBCY|nr:hypothetical protein M413DRAFT_64094 [Hebeloma cylindrosporum h7]
MADIQSIQQFFSFAFNRAQEFLQTNNVGATQFVVPLLAVFVVSRIVKYRQNLQAVSHIPGLRVLGHPIGLPGALLRTTWWNPIGFDYLWIWRNSLYKDYGSDTISVVPFGPTTGGPAIFSANLDVARQVAGGGHKSSFFKPENASRALLAWGMNLVAADKETWRKHRRVMGPAFNNNLYEMVWKQTLTTYREMVSAEGWSDKKEIDIPVIQQLTFKLALIIIGKCGFGFSFNWFAPPKSEGGKMHVQEALKIVSETYMISLFLPKWIKNLPFKRLRESKLAHEQLMEFMHSQVAERKAEIASGSSDLPEGRNDAFTMLIRANEDEGGKFQLDDQELIGNVYIMLFAGHDTTAHTLAATLGFLSLYQDIQEEVYEQIISVVGPDRDPAFEDYPKLYKVLGLFYEAIRMFPAAHLMIREAYEDTVLHIPNPHGHEGVTTVPIQKGLQVVIDMVGVQYNPRYFDAPNEYRPSRWYGTSGEASDSFSAFSIGPRACIGRKFATTEAVCFLTLLLRDFTIHPVMRPGETKQGWRNRVLDARFALTLGVADVPVKFVRRDKRTI